MARHPAYAVTVAAEVEVRADAVSAPIRIVLLRGGTIEGCVVDARGFPVAFVRVEAVVAGDPAPRSAFAGADGTFIVHAVLGSVAVRAYAADFPPAEAGVEVAGGATVQLVIALEGVLHSLAGRTVDGRGFPVSGVRVDVRSQRGPARGSRTAVSGNDGTFEISGLATPP